MTVAFLIFMTVLFILGGLFGTLSNPPFLPSILPPSFTIVSVSSFDLQPFTVSISAGPLGEVLEDLLLQKLVAPTDSSIS